MLTKFDIDFSFHQQLSLNVVKLWYITRGERKKKKERNPQESVPLRKSEKQRGER